MKRRAEYALPDETLQEKINEAESKSKRSKLKARIGFGTTIASTAALNYAERKFNISTPWEMFAAFSGLVYSMVQYLKSIHYENVATEERIILKGKHQAQ